MGGAVKSYVVNVVAQGLGKGATFGANFLIFVLVARLGGADFFGQYSYVLSFLAVAAAAADFGMTSALGRDIAQVEAEADVYWGNYLGLRLAIGLLVTVLSIAALPFLAADIRPVLVVGALFIPFLASRFFEPVYQVFHSPWYSSAASLAYGGAFLVLSGLALWRRPSLPWLILAYGLANAAYLAAAFGISLRLLRPRFTFDARCLQRILAVAAPLGVASLFTIIAGRAPVFILEGLKSMEEVGLFNAAFKFVELTAMGAAMIAGPLIPIYAARVDADREALREEFSLTLEALAVFGIPVALLVPYGSAQILALLYGPAFPPAAAVLNILAWVGLLIFSSLFFTALAVALGVVHFAWWNAGAAALLSIALNFLLIPSLGAPGAAWAALICEIFLMSITAGFVIRHFGNVIRFGAWRRILIANAGLFALLHLLPATLDLFPRIVASLGFYAGAAILLRLLPWAGMARLISHLDFGDDLRHLGRIVKYLWGFIYSRQLLLRVPLQVARRGMNRSWSPPEEYRILSPGPRTDYAEWAGLLNADGGFGFWNDYRVREEIVAFLVTPEAATLIYHRERLVGCFCACRDASTSRKRGYGSWFFIQPEHRHRGLAEALFYRTLAYFPEAGYEEIYLLSDDFRKPALHFYLKHGVRPMYNSLNNLIRWPRILKTGAARRLV
ncbi:MAG: GNAT family N-acetyltransferase [Pseudomonadota bacterium]|nr:GNAT family N-acetyltransferase [Pseudomonadota bacterium]